MATDEQNADDQARPESNAPAAATTKPPANGDGPNRIRIGVIAAVAVLAVLVLMLVVNNVRSGSGDEPAPTPTESPAPKFGPAVVTAEELKAETANVGKTVFWAKKVPGTVLELTIHADNSVMVRYLPEGKNPPVGTGSYLSIVSWTDADAWDRLGRAMARTGAKTAKAPAGTRYVTNADTPNNAFMAIEGQPVLIEAYAPSAGAAWTLISTGQVVPLS